MKEKGANLHAYKKNNNSFGHSCPPVLSLPPFPFFVTLSAYEDYVDFSSVFGVEAKHLRKEVFRACPDLQTSRKSHLSLLSFSTEKLVQTHKNAS